MNQILKCITSCAVQAIITLVKGNNTLAAGCADRIPCRSIGEAICSTYLIRILSMYMDLNSGLLFDGFIRSLTTSCMVYQFRILIGFFAINRPMHGAGHCTPRGAGRSGLNYLCLYVSGTSSRRAMFAVSILPTDRMGEKQKLLTSPITVLRLVSYIVAILYTTFQAHTLSLR